jgi:AraC-like DNA-binding protein
VAIFKNISDKNLNVEKLAELLYLGRTGLYRKIKSEFDITPIAYIRKVRMEFAKKLLIEKKLTVSETAYASGYDSLSYFSKQFKETYSKSPSDFL